jgi:oligoribonuclease (3'-5' exoribonuclease)
MTGENPEVEAIVTVGSAVTDLVEVAEMLPVAASEAERVAKILDRLSEELAEAAGLLRKASARDERFMP